MPKRKICVVGAGVIGLSSAVCIQENIPDVDVTVMADAFSPETTGDGSAGLWLPHLLGPGQEKDILEWGRITFEHLLDLYKSEHAGDLGLILVSGYSFFSEEPVYKDQVFGFRKLTEEECCAIHPDKKPGVTFTNLAIDVKSYLPWLMERFRKKGGTTIKRLVTSLEELKGNYDVIVNCTGLGSRKLLNDKDVRPIRGQIIRVQAPWIKHFYLDNDPVDRAYSFCITPSANDVIVGVTAQKDNWSTKVDKADTDRILEGCCRLIPSLKKAKVLHEWVGLRPQRTKIRLEMESRLPGKTMIVHNYGHSGSGVTLHWGCAQATWRLVLEALQLCTASAKL